MGILPSCSSSVEVDKVNSISEGPVEVFFSVGDTSQGAIQTRTVAGGDGLGTLWQEGDRIALWAIDSGGNATLSAEPFSLYASFGGGAFFSAKLSSSMPEGQYTYIAAYPVPENTSGTRATFSLPGSQDARSGQGEDIMVSSPVVHGALASILWSEYSHEELNLSLDHLLHRLRFYCTDRELLGGEHIQKIVASFPRNVVGSLTLDVSTGEVVSTSATGSVLTIVPSTPVELSTLSDRNYLTASILPTTFSDGEEMSVELYTETKVAKARIPLKSRAFASGHSTPVRIIPDSVESLYRVYFNLVSNNLGEDISSITLTAPSSCRWGDDLSNVYVYSKGEEFSQGESFYLEFESEEAFRSLGGQSITVTYDSPHATISETVAIEDLSGRSSTNVALNVPYLLFEDFSTVPTFSSNDEYSSGFNTGSKDPYYFLDGWSGARVGAEAGKCIRIACRRETSANYHARVDAAPLRGTLKSPVDLSVEFDYGANNQYGGIIIISDPDVGQDCYIGYVTSTGGYKSGDTSGTFESANTFYVKEYSGSYTSTPNTASYTIHNAPAGGVFRLTIRTEIESQAGTNNTTAWLYIDNVKIKIAK